MEQLAWGVVVSSREEEKERLQELYRLALVDTEAEEAFDRITRTVGRVFEMPICLISLVTEDRQWFKSACGLPEVLMQTRETPRSWSFCQHVVASKQMLVVHNAAEHEKYRTLPSVKEMGIGFYAGAPIVTAKGHILGTLCVIDVKPREFDKAGEKMLRDFSKWVAAEIELRDRGLHTPMSRSLSIAGEDDIERAMDITEKLSGEIGWTRTETLLLKLAVEEACTNAYQHGRPGTFQLYWNVGHNDLDIVIYQAGQAFQLRESNEPNVSGRGRGTLLMQEIMDTVVLYDNGDSTELHMRKKMTMPMRSA
ncbi:GAF domain-containing protein [Paenibacillus chartarius]|uniref:GAF domain-containing protein n=1 Tax=Paenibacillus chartarius TaxID=747481 RepID=A0ABV6DM38_9BACL